ncbi:hypothetical protein GQ457_17G011790 [Hibiscus cannabinus]
MTRNNSGELVEFEPEIEAHARRLNAKTRRERRNQQQQREHIPDTNSDTNVISDTHSESDINEPMAEEDQIIRQLAAAPTEQQPLCITFPNGQTPFELKPGLIHLLPTFHGLPSENPHKHLTEFHMVCSSMKPYGVSEDQIKLSAFPFSLADVAKDCQYNPKANTYNPGWRDHPNFSYAQNPRPNQQFQSRPPIQQPYQPPKASLESIVERLALSQEKFQNRTEARLQELDNKMSQLAQAVGRLESQGKSTSQTEANPRENVSAITLQSGTVIEPTPRKVVAASNEKKGEEKLKPDEDQESDAKDKEERKKRSKKEEKVDAQERKQGKSQSSLTIFPYATLPPFPSRLVKRDKQAEEKEILDIFRKMEINIPLLDVIPKITRYARFLKDLCTTKRKLTGNEKVNLGENVSAVFQHKLPPKLKDQGMFSIPCKIGKVRIKRAMCDLRASINVMPLSVYNLISDEPLKETRVIVQLDDRSVIHQTFLSFLYKVKDEKCHRIQRHKNV